MTEPSAVAALVRVLEALEDLRIPHHLGGSYASAVHGVPRQTRDADLVVDLPAAAVPVLVERLGADFYLDEERILHAVAHRSSVNLIHLATGFKVDLFIKGRHPFDEEEFRRSRLEVVPGAAGRTVAVKSPEDTILRKLAWYAEGGGASERQWNDVLGVLKAQVGRLDLDYMRKWAAELGVTELLDRALGEA